MAHLRKTRLRNAGFRAIGASRLTGNLLIKPGGGPADGTEPPMGFSS